MAHIQMLRDLQELFNLIGFVFFKGGWVLLVGLLVYMFYMLYMDFIKIKWYRTLEWVFVKITVPKDNEKSPITFEHILNQLHALHAHITWAEKYLEGQFQIWFTWDIVSIGGQISNIVKILPKHRDTLEAAIYSQFPEAEIETTEDYFNKLPKYDPETSEYDMFAFDFKIVKDDAYPIKTFYDFEHAAADTFVDPMTGMWEELGNLSPYEMYVIQFILRPIGNEWKKRGYQLVKKLKGEPDANAEPNNGFLWLMDKLLGPALDVILRPTPSEGHSRQSEPPPSLMLHLSEGEKDVINAIERNLSKWGYQTKIHCLYLAHKDHYNFAKVNSAVIGAFKAFGSENLNSLKPDLDRWTKINYFLFKDLEKPLHDFRVRWRKREYLKWITRRWYFGGPKPYILNTEELASLLHFPMFDVTVPQIEKVVVTKVQPPPELPIVL